MVEDKYQDQDKQSDHSTNLYRGLTTLEFVVLGLIGMEPQSGYSIISAFESGLFHWSASPGSVYPMLKRLEQQNIIVGQIEAIYETRPRKMYSLTTFGEQLLIEWLHQPLGNQEIGSERGVVMLKFMFIEKHFTTSEIIQWLDSYEEGTNTYDKLLRLQRPPELQDWSLHQQLIIEATIMELNMQRTWIQMARSRIVNQPKAAKKL